MYCQSTLYLTYVYLPKFQCRRLSHRYVTYVSMRVNRNLVHTVRRSIVIALKYGIHLFNIKPNDQTVYITLYNRWSKYNIDDIVRACLYIEKDVKLLTCLLWWRMAPCENDWFIINRSQIEPNCSHVYLIFIRQKLIWKILDYSRAV